MNTVNKELLISEGEIGRLVEVARMYYEKNMTQAAIAKELDVSRPLISKMLEKARTLGIVSIQIRDFLSENRDLFAKLKAKYNLVDGVIVPEANNAYVTSRMVIKQGVAYLMSQLRGDENVGLGWGYTLGAVVEEIERQAELLACQGDVCPLIGTANIPNRGYHTNELVRIFGGCTGLRPNYLFAPVFPSSAQEQDLFSNTENYKEIAALWESLKIAVIGIGAYPSVPDEATATRFGKLLDEEKAVGNILSYYFNEKGDVIESPHDFTLRIPLETLKRIDEILVICPGNVNIASLTGALKLGLITHLVTDEKTAIALLL